MNIKTVRQIADICEENCVTLRELKEKTSSFPSQYFFKEKKDIRKYQFIVWGEGLSIIRGFSLFVGSLGT
jgi:hypothetical protein